MLYHKRGALYHPIIHCLSSGLGGDQKAVDLINLAKGRYAKYPTEELKTQILGGYDKAINPAEKMTKDLKNLGIL